MATLRSEGLRGPAGLQSSVVAGLPYCVYRVDRRGASSHLPPRVRIPSRRRGTFTPPTRTGLLATPETRNGTSAARTVCGKDTLEAVRGERELPPPSIDEHPRTKGFKDFLWTGWLAAARAESGRRRALVLRVVVVVTVCVVKGLSVRGIEVVVVMFEVVMYVGWLMALSIVAVAVV